MMIETRGPRRWDGHGPREYWRKKWKNGVINSAEHLGWSRTRKFMHDLREGLSPKKKAKG